MKSILKVWPAAKRNNARTKTPLPLEMLPKVNRNCTKHGGHNWMYLKTGRKKCTNYLCEASAPYTPNLHAIKQRKLV